MHHPENFISLDHHHNITSTSGEFNQGYSYVHHPSMMSIPNRGVVQVPGWQQFSHSYPVPMPIPIPVHQHHSEDQSVVWNDLMVWDASHGGHHQYQGVHSSSLSSLDSAADNQNGFSNEPLPDSIIKFEQSSPTLDTNKPSVFAPPVVEANGQIKLPINRLRNTKPSHANPRARRVPKISTTAESPVNNESNTSLSSSPTSTTPTISNNNPPLRQKKAHSIIEKKYRTTINQALTQLRLAVPELNPKSAPPKGAPPIKLNKANILRKATQHISNLEQERETLRGQLDKFIQFIEMSEGGREFLQQAQVDHDIGSNA